MGNCVTDEAPDDPRRGGFAAVARAARARLDVQVDATAEEIAGRCALVTVASLPPGADRDRPGGEMPQSMLMDSPDQSGPARAFGSFPVTAEPLQSSAVVLELIAARRIATVYAAEADTLRTALVALAMATDRLLAEFPAGQGGPRAAEVRTATDAARAVLNPPTDALKDPA